MHSHDCEVIPLIGKSYIKWGITLSFFEISENCFRISKNIFRPDEASHGSLNAHDRSLSTDGSRGAFGITELFACSNSSPRYIMSHKHTNSMLDMEG